MHPLDAISEPRRRDLLATIAAEREISVADLASTVDISRPAVSQHLRILKDAGLVVERKVGRKRLYRIEPAGLERARATIETFLVNELDDLETAARRLRSRAPSSSRSIAKESPHA